MCRTSAPSIYAAGDCCSFPSGKYGRRIRLESVQNAIDQAKAAVLAMLGKGAQYARVPWFWSDQFDTKLQIAGLSQGADNVVLRGDMEAPGFSVAYLKDGRLIALDAVNQPKDYMMARCLVPGSFQANERDLSDPDVSLRDLVAAPSPA
jgi:3-phenylpropionate/trans-cinnamate dioxygenase ferredoxin reductase subunit